MLAPTSTTVRELTIDIGAIPILVRTESAEFAQMLADRYGEFVNADAPPAAMELEIRLEQPGYGRRETAGGSQRSGGRRQEPEEQGESPIANRQSPAPSPQPLAPDLDLSVRREAGRWVMERGDFRAEWDPECRRGWVRQTANPYSIDGVLRILHSLILAREGGFLVHAASAVRDGRAFVFAGVSGAGKTTISRLAPPDVTLLTDEISYVKAGGRSQEQVSGARRQVSGASGEDEEVRSEELGARKQEVAVRRPAFGVRRPKSEVRIPKPEPLTPNPESLAPISATRVPCPEPLTPDTWHLTPSFTAFGTPFAGELARIGQKVQAPLATLFLLQQGAENRIEPVGESQAVRELMRHVLFFAQDEELVGMIFQTVCDFVRRVPVRRLVFTKDASVWELIR